MREFAKQFYKSQAWRSCRQAYFIMQHGLCERCTEAGKIVHHTIYLTPENINDPNFSLNHELLELLCMTCHNKEHHGGDVGFLVDGLEFNEHGDLVQCKIPPH